MAFKNEKRPRPQVKKEPRLVEGPRGRGGGRSVEDAAEREGPKSAAAVAEGDAKSTKADKEAVSPRPSKIRRGHGHG